MKTKTKLTLLLSVFALLWFTPLAPAHAEADFTQTFTIKAGVDKKLSIPSRFTNNSSYTVIYEPRTSLYGWGQAGKNMVSVTSDPAELTLLPGDTGEFSFTVRFSPKVKSGTYQLNINVYATGDGVIGSGYLVAEYALKFQVESSDSSIKKIFSHDPYKQKLYVYQSGQGTYGYVNASKKVVIPAKFQTAKAFNARGIAQVSVNGKYGFINKQGAYVTKPQFDEVGGQADGMIAVKSGNNWGFVNEAGKIAVKPKYAIVGSYSNGLADVYLHNGKKLGKGGYINKQGKLVIPAVYDSVTNFSKGQAIVSKNGRYYYINAKGKIIKEATDIIRWG
jgi:hypothetical protein